MMRLDIQKHKFIFVCGLHRSGTSILHRCLSEHPSVSGFTDTGAWEDEGQHLQSLYPPAKFYGGPGVFAFNKDAHLTETSPLICEENRNKLFSEWRKYWDLEKPFLLEKSPPNLVGSRFLQKMFPKSYFIMVMRHPVAVSYATHKFVGGSGRGSSTYSLINHWLRCHEIFYEDNHYLNNTMVLKYEDFVSNHGSCLERIYSWLGLDNHLSNLEVRSNINERYFDKWKNCQFKFSRFEKYTGKLLSRYYRDLLIKKYEKRVYGFGYSLCDLDLIN